jgi:hypothetical protein
MEGDIVSCRGKVEQLCQEVFKERYVYVTRSVERDVLQGYVTGLWKVLKKPCTHQ